MRSIALILFFVACVFLCARGQDAEQLNFRHFRVEDGLSQGSINAILQDHKGFIWIGTYDGLNRFDGMEFKIFRNEPGNPRSLSSNWVTGIVEGDSGALWVMTEKGVDRFNRATELFLHIDRENRDLWPVAESLFARNKGPAISEAYGIGTNGVTAILPSRLVPGDVWLGRASDLLRLRNGKSEFVGKFSIVTSFAEDSHGFLWIGTQDGLARLDPRDSTGARIARFYHDPVVSTSLSHNVVTQVFQDVSGSLWVGTYSGLNLFDRYSPSFSIYRSSPDNPESLGDNFVMPIVEDRIGNIWFGTFSAGVSVLQKSGQEAGTFIHFRHDSSNPNSLRSDNVRSMICGNDGRVWISSTRGLNLYDPATRRMTTVLSGSTDDWPSYWIESMCESRGGSVWVPFKKHLMRLDWKNRVRDNVRRFPIPGGREYVFIHEDSEGLVWLATVGAGLIRFDPHTETFKRYEYDPKNPASLSSNNVWTIFEDTKDTSGALWIGTSHGLNRLDTKNGACTRYLEQEGFPNAWVYGILQDDLQRLWLSTNQGLVVFDDCQPEGRKFRNFTHADGLAGDEFNRRSYCRLRSGEFLFGGPNGVTRFRPAMVRDNPIVPPLVMTGFYKLGNRVAFEKDIADVTSIELMHDENVFSFEFTALNYSNASKNRYAYKMEGIDRDWILAGNRRSVNYAFVPPGEYIFRVKASHTSGIWNSNELAVRVHILPPYWATAWFIALCTCASVGLIAAVVRARVKRLLDIERLRSRIARDLHDEIGSNLSSIAMASDLLGRHSGLGEKERSKLSEISSVALNTVKDMKDIVWLIKPGNDSLDDLFLRMKDTATTLLEGYRYTLNFPSTTNGKRVNLEWKRNLYLIYKETLTNVIRHAHATSVTVDVHVEADRLMLQVLDNGMGFNPNAERSGNGLRNIRERADLLQARLNIEARPGNGTTVRLETRIT